MLAGMILEAARREAATRRRMNLVPIALSLWISESTPSIDALPQKRRREIHARNSGFEEYEIAGRYGKV
jgi:hypothetical protein